MDCDLWFQEAAVAHLLGNLSKLSLSFLLTISVMCLQDKRKETVARLTSNVLNQQQEQAKAR